jgi:hypothetical protein
VIHGTFMVVDLTSDDVASDDLTCLLFDVDQQLP